MGLITSVAIIDSYNDLYLGSEIQFYFYFFDTISLTFQSITVRENLQARDPSIEGYMLQSRDIIKFSLRRP